MNNKNLKIKQIAANIADYNACADYVTSVMVSHLVRLSNNAPCLMTQFQQIIRSQHFSLFAPNYQLRHPRLISKKNSHQLAFVAHHIHLCFQARMFDESQLAPHPRL